MEHVVEAGPLETAASSIYGSQGGSAVERHFTRPEAHDGAVLVVKCVNGACACASEVF